MSIYISFGRCKPLYVVRVCLEITHYFCFMLPALYSSALLTCQAYLLAGPLGPLASTTLYPMARYSVHSHP